MSEIKNHWKKWIYWFLLGVAIGEFIIDIICRLLKIIARL